MRRVAMVLGLVVGDCRCGFALNPSLDISQYAHTAWTARDGIFKGNIYSVAQTCDGYLWLGTEFGLFRFDGVHSVLLQPPDGPNLPDKAIFRLLGTRDGTLWIGTFNGLAAWSGGKQTRVPELQGQVIGSLIEDRDGTVWAGTWLGGPPPGRLCAIRNGAARCYGEDGVFGRRVSSLYEDGAGNLWAGAASGIFRWKPGPPKRYAIPAVEVTGLSEAGDGRLIGASYGAGLMQLVTDKVGSYPVRGAIDSNRPIRDRDVNANKLLRDRDGGLWIGTVERGLIHLHNGRTDVFTRSDGLSGDIILSLFEDREGNIWVSTTGGLDRFREFAVTAISAKQGLSSDATSAVLAAPDGSIWMGAHDGLTRWNNGQSTIFRKASGLPSDFTNSLFQDDRERIWVFTDHGPAYFRDGRFVFGDAVISGDTCGVTEDRAGDLWISQTEGLSRLREGHLLRRIPWSDLRRDQRASVVLAGPVGGGLWLGFWNEGGLLYFKDGQLRASHTTRDGLGAGHIADLRLDHDGALWVATQDGGIATLTSRNGLPCDTIHWTIEDDDRSLWLYTACGLVRIRRTELNAWIADPKRTIERTIWDASDGVKLRTGAASPYAPRIAKARDGRLWFLSGEGVQVVDPRRLAENKTPPPVRIERVEANNKSYEPRIRMRLPANVRDFKIEFTALSLVAPEKIHFKYMLDGQDPHWKEVVNDRDARYSNLKPRKYRFRVVASNNSGLWNETGDTLEFSVDPAFHETAWFYALSGAAFLTFVWGLHRLRLHQLAREFNARVEERTRIARELHDTLLQSFQGLMFSFQAVRNLLPARSEEAIRVLDKAIGSGDAAIAEGRNAIQGLRATPTLESDFGHLLATAGNELASASSSEGEPAKFRVAVEGMRQPLSPLLQDEVYRIACEILRNAFHHAKATRIEAEITYDSKFFRLRIRDDGKGIDRNVLEHGGDQGHWGLRGVRERAKSIGARLKLWSEPGAGTEADLTVPARIAYGTARRHEGSRLVRKGKVEPCSPDRT